MINNKLSILYGRWQLKLHAGGGLSDMHSGLHVRTGSCDFSNMEQQKKKRMYSPETVEPA